MEQQNQVILSLGSNQGNRLENIKHCIKSIHEQLGTVVAVSKLYQTPAWGFESDAFYNCALLMHTQHSPNFVLERILQIETQIGRIRTNSQGYQARWIDIDLIAFDNQIVATATLQVPHPLMHKRNFVLLPFADLGIAWEHPVLKKDLANLLLTSEDESICLPIANLDVPLQTEKINATKFIAIEGNIGSGKTSLASRMAQDFKRELVLEQFADNPFLDSFYKDPEQYAFLLEMSFLADRHQQFTADLAPIHQSNTGFIADYHISKSLIFAKVTLAEAHIGLYTHFFDQLHQAMPKPDLYVFLHQNTDRLLQNIQKRGRSYEQTIQDQYLSQINQGYLDFIKNQTEIKVLVIDVSNLDFVNNQADYLFVLEKINACL